MTGGEVSVQCFYIISGFLISLILNEKYVGASATRVFYSNRFLRIFPLYWMFLALAFLVGIAAYSVAHKGALAIWHDNWSRLSAKDAVFLVCSNLFLFGQDWTTFLRLGNTGLEWSSQFYLSEPGVYQFLFVPQGWSLGLELTFYLLAPFIARQSSWAIGLIVAVSLLVRIVAYTTGLRSDPWSYRFFPFEVSLFLIGAFAYRLGKRIEGMVLHRPLRAFAYGIIPAVILFPLYNSGLDDFFLPSQIFLYAYLVLALPMLFRLSKHLTWDRTAGDLSYPVYLCHLIPIQLLQGSSALSDHPGVRALLAVVGTVILAAVATKYVEIPLDKYRQKRVRVHGRAKSDLGISALPRGRIVVVDGRHVIQYPERPETAEEYRMSQ